MAEEISNAAAAKRLRSRVQGGLTLIVVAFVATLALFVESVPSTALAKVATVLGGVLLAAAGINLATNDKVAGRIFNLTSLLLGVAALILPLFLQSPHG